MGSNRRKKGKTSEKNRVWNEWQQYVRKETQRLKQKSGSNVVQVKFAPKQQSKPPEDPAPSETAEHPEQPIGEYTARSEPVEGVPREEALQVSDDHVGRTVKPFTVDDYRRIRPMNLMGDDDSSEEPVEEPIPDAIPVEVITETVIEDVPTETPVKKVIEPETEKKSKSKGKQKKGKKDKKGDGKIEELELFGSVSDHQVMTRQRLTRKNKLDRDDLIEKLLDPVISLEEAATLIGVCKTTVRRYTNRGEIDCLRTPGQQRRFKLSQVLEFVKKREEASKFKRKKRSTETE